MKNIISSIKNLISKQFFIISLLNIFFVIISFQNTGESHFTLEVYPNIVVDGTWEACFISQRNSNISPRQQISKFERENKKNKWCELVRDHWREISVNKKCEKRYDFVLRMEPNCDSANDRLMSRFMDFVPQHLKWNKIWKILETAVFK